MQNKENILIIDDDKTFCRLKTMLLEDNGYTVVSAHEPDKALDLFKSSIFDLILVDLRIGDKSGIDVLLRIKEIDSNMVVIMITEFASVSVAVEAIKKGAYDYLTKDIDDEELLLKIERALGKHRDREEITNLKEVLTERFSFANIIGQNPKIKNIYSLIKKIYASDTTVLIYGETGTGKELIAKAIHFNSIRGNKPFITINCAAISEHLIESELFGHEKGAFTGAYSQRLGKAELANGGTLFLDEIGDMPINLQTKLLRFLQDKGFERVGGNVKITSDVRIVSSTNRNLEEMIKIAIFREDLYYRINVMRIDVPPLRERMDDLPLLVNHFIKTANIMFKKNVKNVSDDGMKRLMDYNWPGNIRELKHLIETLVLTAEKDIITVPEILNYISRVETATQKEISTEIGLKEAREDFEKRYLTKLLRDYHGNVSLAAQKGNIERTTLFLKMKKYGLKKEHFKQP